MKSLKVVVLTFLALFVCFNVLASPAAEAFKPVTVTDQIGRVVEVKSKPEKIVSGYYISSSACIALGLKDNLVAVEALADKRPIYRLAAAELMNKPNVGTAKSFSLETCISVEPDLVILPKKQKETAEILGELGIPAIVVNPENHEQIIEMFELIGKVTGNEKAAEKLVDRYRKILNFVDETVRNVKSKPVVYICGTESYLTTAPRDMYQGKLIELAGGINAAESIEGSSKKKISYEQLIAFNPDIIIIPTNSTADGPADFSVEDIMSDKLLQNLNAVKNGKVYQMPVGYESWDSPVPSGALGALWMLSVFHPELYSEAELKKDVNSFYRELYGFEAGF